MDAYSLVEDILFNELKERVEQVINGEKDSIEIKFLYLSDVKSFLEDEYKAKEVGDMDTNGWQYDYFVSFEINDKKYELTGSGYYGDMLFANGDYDY